MTTPHLGTGIGWRPEIAEAVEDLSGLDWVEVVAENVCPGHLPDSVVRLRARGVTVVPHGVSLGLGGAERPDPQRLADLAARVEALGAPLVSEHIAFVRAGGPLTATPGAPALPALEAGHLLPVPRTWDALRVLCENVRSAQDALPVPLAVENIAALVGWPDEELTEQQFLTELVERTGVLLLVDVANLHTNHVNRGEDPAAVLDGIPLDALAYVHVAGGVERDGVWHDTHAHPVTRPVLDVLAALRARVTPPGVLLERDDDFPPVPELARELDALRAPAGTGAAPEVRRTRRAAPPGAVPEAGEAARRRLARAEAGLLTGLTAGGPLPDGFDVERLGVQSRALAGKRASVVAKVAPELPALLGAAYRPAFLAYAAGSPLRGTYRRDALDFAAHVLAGAPPADRSTRRALHLWWQERAGARPPRRAMRLARMARAALQTR